MSEHRGARSPSTQGFAMMTAVLFVFVIILAGFTFFAVSSYETRQARYRQDSSEAFYLADGAVERARAAFLADGTWRDGFMEVASGNGKYMLAVTDTTFMGVSDAVHILSEGSVGQASRRIEVMAEVQPTALGLTLLIMGDADVGGNLCIEGGPIHVNGEGDFGPNDVHLACGEFTDDFELLPPPLYTDPAHYPDATYYFVRGAFDGPMVYGRVYDRFGTDITSTLIDSLQDVADYDASESKFIWDFDSVGLVDKYFQDPGGIFARLPGATAVVVNFGEAPLADPPGAAGISDITIDSNPGGSINCTIINTRFTGVTLAERYDTNFWMGGLSTVKQIIWEPFYGFSIIPHDFEKQGGSLVQMGTEAYPALVYATGDVVDMTSNYEHIGGFITLGDWNSQGGPNLIYDSDFLANLPGWIVEGWEEGESGTLRIMRWREVAAID